MIIIIKEGHNVWFVFVRSGLERWKKREVEVEVKEVITQFIHAAI